MGEMPAFLVWYLGSLSVEDAVLLGMVETRGQSIRLGEGRSHLGMWHEGGAVLTM